MLAASRFPSNQKFVLRASCVSATKHVRYRCFEDWESAATFLRTEKGCDLCGIVAQSRNTPPGTCGAPPSSGSAASPVEAAPPRAAGAAGAVMENADPEEVEEKDNTGAAGPGSPTPASPEQGKLPAAVEQLADDAVAEGAEERPSLPTPSSPTDQSLESSQEGPERGNKDRRAVAASTAVRRRPFRRSTAFLVGHRNRLEGEALRVCDFLVHVEQVLVRGGNCVLLFWCIRDCELFQTIVHTFLRERKPNVVATTTFLCVHFLRSFL